VNTSSRHAWFTATVLVALIGIALAPARAQTEAPPSDMAVTPHFSDLPDAKRPISGTVTIRVTGTAPPGSSSTKRIGRDGLVAEARVDRTSLGVFDSLPYTITWDTGRISDGAHTLHLLVVDTRTDRETEIETTPVLVANHRPRNDRIGPLASRGGSVRRRVRKSQAVLTVPPSVAAPVPVEPIISSSNDPLSATASVLGR
jgi:hypothetical protein